MNTTTELTIQGPFTKQSVLIVDTEDVSKIEHLNWRVRHDGYVTNKRTINTFFTVETRLHRFILGLPEGREIMVDHVNGNKLDNRKCNLRICSNSQNQYNKKKVGNGQSKYKGVFKTLNNRWYAQITNGNKRAHLFTSDNEAACAIAYNKAASIIAKRFCYLNKVTEPISDTELLEINRLVPIRIKRKFGIDE